MIGMSANIVRTAKHLARRIIGRPIFGRSILMYHRIANADFDPWNIAVSPDEFARQLEELRSKNVLPLLEFARLHRQEKLPRSAVAITFDDGYACNAVVAAPMLKSFGYPATFFVVSDAIRRSEEFWWDQLENIFHAAEFDYETATRLLARYTANGPGVEAVQKRTTLASFLALWDILRHLPTERRRQYLDELRRQSGLEKKTRPTHRPMTESELRALAANPLFEIGGHTATHPSLPTLAMAKQGQEIIVGSRFLETTLGKSIRSFAYPFGDWRPATRDIVRAAGFDCAVTGEHRRVRPGDHQFELPRRQVVNRHARTL
jgi:peptidoglycan/xylan/chitin deacetylase (PgdA/CDA1 family)